MAVDDTSNNTRQKVIDLDKLLAEKFGREGDGGDFKHLEDSVAKHAKTLETHDVRITALETFNVKLGVIKGLLLMAGGVAVTLVMKALDKLL